MSKALLQLDDYWITRVGLQCVSDEPAGAVAEPGRPRLPRVDWDLQASPEGKSYLMTMAISEKSARLRFSLEIAGTFSFAGSPPPEQQARLLSLNGPSILYGIARGVMGDLTGLTPGGKHVLPSLNFVELVSKRARAHARAHAKAEKVASQENAARPDSNP